MLEQGYVQAGDPIDVVDQPSHAFTVATMFRALTTEPACSRAARGRRAAARRYDGPRYVDAAGRP